MIFKFFASSRRVLFFFLPLIFDRKSKLYQKMLNDNTKTTANNVWDTKTQTFHGGQEHRFINNFVEDFSVTTNYLGTPRKALEAAKEAVSIPSSPLSLTSACT